MSIFGTIMAKIFHPNAAAAAPAPASPGAAAPTGVGSSTATAAPNAGPGAQHDDPTAMTGASGAASVDVGKVLDDLAAKNSQTLDWKHSIVDMMKLLGLDSSLTARQELAKELNYTGDTQDSATMNVWLHKQVMQKLAANGGKVPDDLKV